METFKGKVGTLLLDEFRKEQNTPEGQLKLHSESFHDTGNPIHLLAAFCYHVFVNADNDGNVLFPQWMTTPLTQGFSKYLDSIAEGEDVSLEQALGITDEIKKEER